MQVTLAEYSAAVDAFENAVNALETAKAAENLGRKTRDVVQKLVKAKLIAYPVAAKGRLADGDPLRATIPTLTGG